MTTTTLREAGQKFHAHVAGCERCTERPFDLCELGAQLLQVTAAAEPAPAEVPAEDPEPVVVMPGDAHLFARALRSVLDSRTKAVGVVDGGILRDLLLTLEGKRESRS